MNHKRYFPILPIAALLAMSSCQSGYIGHSGSTRLVILQPVRMEDRHFTRNFREALELLCPHECHDSTFIQDRVFLERIDRELPFSREFVIAPNLVRDFFGSNNPEKKRALREEILFFGDSAFEKYPDAAFLDTAALSDDETERRIGDFLDRLQGGEFVYIFSRDTLAGYSTYNGKSEPVYHDYARLNCRIVADLAVLERRQQASAGVVVILLPERRKSRDAAGIADPEAVDYPVKGPAGEKTASPGERRNRKKDTGSAMRPSDRECPPDSAVARLNRERQAVITEFRNLLHCIATTRDDGQLKRRYREEAGRTLLRIPSPLVEGVPSGDLDRFLASEFSARVTVAPLFNGCRVIEGIRIEGK